MISDIPLISSLMPKLKILYYTSYFSHTLKEAFGFSPSLAQDLCVISTDQNDLASADAVVFHIPNLREPPQEIKKPGQLWVAFSMESEMNYPLQKSPEFMQHFDLQMNFRKDADIQMLYFHPELLPALHSPPKWKYRRAPAVYFSSNDKAHNNRTYFVKELMQLMRVHSYGKSQNNRFVLWDKGQATKLNIISRYRFYLAFENSNSVDYVTEKVFDGLIAGTVPVYLGAPNIDDYLPATKCIIKASDFPTAADLSRYLAFLIKDKKEYETYLAWKKEPLKKSFLDLVNREKIPPLRRLCYKILELAKNR